MEARKHEAEQVKLYNLVMVEDGAGQVLVLNKVKRYGWEGLTFPGGKVEPGESLADSARREALEETGLQVGALDLVGCIHWYNEGEALREIGLLYRTQDFQGQVQSSAEGDLTWMPYADFRAQEPKSDCMDEMLDIYEGKAKEVIITYRQGRKAQVVFRD